MQKVKDSAEDPEQLNVASFTPEVGQNVASHASPAVRNSTVLSSPWGVVQCTFFFFFLPS